MRLAERTHHRVHGDLQIAAQTADSAENSVNYCMIVPSARHPVVPDAPACPPLP